jgi:hypothetical protein
MPRTHIQENDTPVKYIGTQDQNLHIQNNIND